MHSFLKSEIKQRKAGKRRSQIFVKLNKIKRFVLSQKCTYGYDSGWDEVGPPPPALISFIPTLGGFSREKKIFFNACTHPSLPLSLASRPARSRDY